MVSVSETSVFCESDDEECLRSSISNEIACINFHKSKLLLLLGTIADDRISSDSRWLSTNFSRYAMVHCNNGPQIHDAFLMRATRGIYFALLKGLIRMGETLDHAVAIDVEHCTILDSCAEV